MSHQLLLERVQQSLTSNNHNYRKTLHHFASNGDVEAVQSLLVSSNTPGTNTPTMDIDIHSPRTRTTALHAALIQNQQGFIIPYLISQGADVNLFNIKGFNPMILAVKHCRNGTQALETLIENGGDYKKRFEKGRFAGLTLLDLAIQWKNDEAGKVLRKYGCVENQYMNAGDDDGIQNEQYCQFINSENSPGNNHTTMKSSSIDNKTIKHNAKNSANSKKAMCPFCRCNVKYPTRMHFLKLNQEQAEKEYYHLLKAQQQQQQQQQQHPEKPSPHDKKHISIKTKKGSEIYIRRKYLDQFMTHNSGESYKELCKIEYHGVGNMGKLRKEISESYSILHAIQTCWRKIQIQQKGIHHYGNSNVNNDEGDDEKLNFKNVFIIDLCSGKSMTAALCSVLFPKEYNNKVLAVDKLPSHMVPHYDVQEEYKKGGGVKGMKMKDSCITYLSRDIMTDTFYNELEEEIKYHTSRMEYGKQQQQHQQQQCRTVVLVGMHLCGKLSERAIEFFNKIQDIQAIVLSPCCLPKLRKGKDDTFMTSKESDEDKYMDWSNHLKALINIRMSGDYELDDQIDSYFDHEMHSTKNSIITATRRISS